MPKRSSNRRPGGPRRKLTSRREREARARRWLIVGTAVVLGLMVLILAWGLYDQYVLRPRQPVATVAGEVIPLRAYQDLVRYRRWYYGNYLGRLEDERRQLLANTDAADFLVQYVDEQIAQLQSELTNLSVSVLEEMIDDRLVRQECARQGITVSAEEVQLELEAQFGYQRNPPPTPVVTATLPITATPAPTTAPMTEQEFVTRSSSWFQEAREATGLGESEYRSLLEGMLYREKLEEVIIAGVPTEADQVRARHILVETREEAEAVLDQLAAGEDFEELAGELSQDPSTKEQGGDLGWFPREQMTATFGEAAFALEPGEVSQVVETEFGYHIIRVEEREANRELDAGALWQAQRKAVSDWLTAQRVSQNVVRSWDSSMVPGD